MHSLHVETDWSIRTVTTCTPFLLSNIKSILFFTFLQFDADVVGCIRDPNTDDVTAIDTWNALANTRNNIRDDTQDIVLFNSTFINSRISCTFSRLISGSDPAPQDRNLDNDYFILYGYRGGDNPANDIMRLPIHDVTPVSSSVMFNPVNGNNQPFNNVTIPVSCYACRYAKMMHALYSVIVLVNPSMNAPLK
jgi:hypothetical protein